MAAQQMNKQKGLHRPESIFRTGASRLRTATCPAQSGRPACLIDAAHRKNVLQNYIYIIKAHFNSILYIICKIIVPILPGEKQCARIIPRTGARQLAA